MRHGIWSSEILCDQEKNKVAGWFPEAQPSTAVTVVEIDNDSWKP